MNSKIFQAVVKRDCNELSKQLKDDTERMKILAKDEHGRTVLIVAAQNMDSNILKMLMELPESRQLISVNDCKGMNVIHYLCLASKKDPENDVWEKICSNILKCKESSTLFHDKTVEGNQNILHFAAQQSSASFLNVLLKHQESRRIIKEVDSLNKAPIDYSMNKEIRTRFSKKD